AAPRRRRAARTGRAGRARRPAVRARRGPGALPDARERGGPRPARRGVAVGARAVRDGGRRLAAAGPRAGAATDAGGSGHTRPRHAARTRGERRAVSSAHDRPPRDAHAARFGLADSPCPALARTDGTVRVPARVGRRPRLGSAHAPRGVRHVPGGDPVNAPAMTHARRERTSGLALAFVVSLALAFSFAFVPGSVPSAHAGPSGYLVCPGD